MQPRGITRLGAVLDASGAFTQFATEYLRANKITAEFDVRPEVIDEFRVFVSQRGIQPSVGEWLADRPFIVNRLKTELFNQAFGVEKGDEVEAQRDAQIERAVASLG